MSIKIKKEALYSSSFFIENNTDRLRKVKKIFSRYKGERLLDIGCGVGSFTLQLREFAGELYGVEISKEAMKFAQERGIKVSQLDIDEDNLPFRNDFFDIIFCGQLIEHLFDPDHLLDEIYRTLKPKGIAIITTPNLASYLNRLALLLGFQPYLTGTGLRYNTGKLLGQKAPCPHLMVLTLKSLKELLQLHNFNVKEIVGVNASHLLPFPLRTLDRFLSRIPCLAIYLIFVIEKE